MAVQTHMADIYSTGYVRACRHIIASEGVASLWSGVRVTLLGIVPYSGLSFCIFETLKVLPGSGAASFDGDARRDRTPPHGHVRPVATAHSPWPSVATIVNF